MSPARASANDRDTVAPIQKIGAVASKVTAAARWPLETRIDEMLRDPEALRLAYARLVASEGPPALTDRQRDLLQFVRQHQARTGTSPTYRGIAAGIGVSLSCAYTLINGLEARGIVTKRPRSAQSIVIVEARV